MSIKKLLGTIALSFLMIFTSFSIPVFQTRAYAFEMTPDRINAVNSLIEDFANRFGTLQLSVRMQIIEYARDYYNKLITDDAFRKNLNDILDKVNKANNNNINADTIAAFFEVVNSVLNDTGLKNTILDALEANPVDTSQLKLTSGTSIVKLYEALMNNSTTENIINTLKQNGIKGDTLTAILVYLSALSENDSLRRYVLIDRDLNLYVQYHGEFLNKKIDIGPINIKELKNDEIAERMIISLLNQKLQDNKIDVTYNLTPDDLDQFIDAYYATIEQLNKAQDSATKKELFYDIMSLYVAPYTPTSGGVGGGVVPSEDEQKNQQAQQVISDLIEKMAEKNNSQAVAALTSVLDTLKGVNVNSDTKAKLLEAINQVIAKVSAVTLKSEDGKTYNVSADDISAFLDANNLSAKLKDIGINDIEVKMPKVFKLKVAANNEADIVLPSGSLKKLGDNNIGVEVERDDVNITLPAGFVNIGTTGDVKLSIAKLSDAQLAPIKEKVQNTEFARQNIVATPYEFTLNINGSMISQFNKALTVNIKYDKSTVRDAKKINAYYFDTKDNSWKYIRSKVDINNAQVTFNTAHFTTFALMEYNRTFSDIQNDWAKSDIEYIASKYITDGVGNNKFMPAGKVTRAQFVAFIVRTLGLDPVAYNSEFKDVKSSEWYAQYVATAVKAGIIKGYGDGKFGPNDKVTREQMAVMIMRAYTLVTGKSSSDISTTKSFSDMNKVSSWAVNDVKASAELGIIKGYPGGSFGPRDFMLRDQAAGILSRLINITGLY